MKTEDIVDLLIRAAAGLETPGDLSDRELVDLIEDLRDAAQDLEDSLSVGRWVIRHQTRRGPDGSPLHWNANDGWVPSGGISKSAEAQGWIIPNSPTEYTDNDRRGGIALPAGGEWVRIAQKEK